MTLPCEPSSSSSMIAIVRKRCCMLTRGGCRSVSPCSIHTRRSFGPSSSPYYPHLLRSLNVTMTLPTTTPQHRNSHHAERTERHWRAGFGDLLRSGEGQRESSDMASNPHWRAEFGDFLRPAHVHEHAQAQDTRTHTPKYSRTHTHAHAHAHAQRHKHDPKRTTEWTLISTRGHHRFPQEGSGAIPH